MNITATKTVVKEAGNRRWAARDFSSMLEPTLKRISARDRDVATEYIKSLRARERKSITLYGNALALLKLDQYLDPLGKAYGEVSRADLEEFFVGLSDPKGRELRQSTRTFYKAKIKSFYGEKYPDLYAALGMAKWLEVKRRMTYKELTDRDILTREEIRRMIEVATTERDRAIIAVLFESGTRFTEFRSLHIGDVYPGEDGGADLALPNDALGLKTGRRTITIAESWPYLQRWMEVHPGRKDPRAPLWPPMHGGYRPRPADDEGLRSLIGNIAKAAKVKRAVNPHAFRHARATDCAKRQWNEQQMRDYFGWGPGSEEPSRYVRLAQADVRHRVLEDAGIKPKGKPEESPLKAIACYWCHSDNPATATFCGKCGRPISLEAVTELRRKERILDLERVDRDTGARDVMGEDALVQAYRQGLRDALKRQRGSA